MDSGRRLKLIAGQPGGDGLAEVIGRLGEHRLQFGEPLVIGILPPKPGGSFKLGNARIERAVLVVRGAETAQARVRLIAYLLYDGLGDARLADPGLSRDQDNAAITTRGLFPSAKPSGQRCQGLPL